MARYEHETRVGNYVVRDAGIEFASPTPDLTLADVARYEQRAASTVLRDARDVDGAVLRFARRAMGLRQKELAELLEVTESTVSKWENGEEPFRRTTQLAIAAIVEQVEAFGVDHVKRRLMNRAPAKRVLRAS